MSAIYATRTFSHFFRSFVDMIGFNDLVSLYMEPDYMLQVLTNDVIKRDMCMTFDTFYIIFANKKIKVNADRLMDETKLFSVNSVM